MFNEMIQCATDSNLYQILLIFNKYYFLIQLVKVYICRINTL